YFATKFDTAVFLTKGQGGVKLFEGVKFSPQEGSIVKNPNWKVVGIARCRSEKNGATRWVLGFADYWVKTAPLPGQDTDCRMDGNERIRPRPPYDALLMNAKFSGYGDDGKPYSTRHCDLETNECWKDPAPATNRSLRELSMPENMIGIWHAQYQVSSRGGWH